MVQRFAPRSGLTAFGSHWSDSTIHRDRAGLAIDPFLVNESGTSATFEISLSRAPLTDVILDFASLDTGEFTVSPASLRISPENWNLRRIVTVTGVDDAIVDGTQSVDVQISVNESSDPAFAALPAD